MISELGGFLDFAIDCIQHLLGFFAVASQAVFILPLSFVELRECLLDVMLCFGEIRMPVRINVHYRTLSEGKPAANQGAS